MIISHIYTNFCWYVKYLPVFFGHRCQLPDLHIMIPIDRKEGWAPNNWCFSLIMLEKTLESPLDSKEIKPVNLKENQSWIFIERTDAEAEDPIFCPFDVKSWLTGNDHDAGKDWEQEEKRVTEDEMVGWHHWLHEYELEQSPGDGEGQGSLAWCNPWIAKSLTRLFNCTTKLFRNWSWGWKCWMTCPTQHSLQMMEPNRSLHIRKFLPAE